jgi:hypothetical protein
MTMREYLRNDDEKPLMDAVQVYLYEIKNHRFTTSHPCPLLVSELEEVAVSCERLARNARKLIATPEKNGA